MKLLSYSFFEPMALPKHRTWDKHKSAKDRYYFNVPAVAMTNQLLYPDYRMDLYMTRNVGNNPLSAVFAECNVGIWWQDEQYDFTEPSMFRMQPLWSDMVDIFHTRDIDSLPTEDEYRFVRCFEKSSCSIGTLRTHPNHYGGGCKMLAGLSSFKPNGVLDNIKGSSFKEYFDSSHKGYGCDQDIMIKTFTKDKEFTKNNFYDCVAHQQTIPQDFPCQSCSSEEMESVNIPYLSQVVLDKVKECGFDNWAGEPIDARGEYTNFMLQYFLEIKTELLKNQMLADFYKVE